MVELSPLVEQSVSRCPESLFYPPPANTSLTGIHQHVYILVLQCDEGKQQELRANIVVAGGNTMFEGITSNMVTK